MSQHKDKPKKEKQALNSYVKYSGLGFQMIGIIGAFTFAGYKIDEAQNSSTPIFTALLSVIGVSISLYFIFKGLK